MLCRCVRRGGLAVVCAALAVLLPTEGRADRLVVGVENINYSPHYAVVDHAFTDFARAVLDAFATDRGHRMIYRPLPVKRLFQELLQGDIDLKYPANPNWQPALKVGHRVVYSAPVTRYVDGLFVVPGDVGKTLADIRTVGTVRGFSPVVLADAVAAGIIQVHENSSFVSLVQMGVLGRVGAIYGNVSVIGDRLKRLGKSASLVFDPGLPHDDGAYHLATVKSPAAIADFDAWIADHADRVAEMEKEHGLVR